MEKVQLKPVIHDPVPSDYQDKFWFAYDSKGDIVKNGRGHVPYALLKGIPRIISLHISTYKKHETRYAKELALIRRALITS